MKTLQLRLGFFANKKDNNPKQTRPITANYSPAFGGPWINQEIEEEIAGWMIEHPNGKIVIIQ